jgi:hypothetical protein
MKTVCFVFLFVMMLGGVLASGFSPSSLIYEVGVDEEMCSDLSVSSDSEVILVSDAWASDESVDWKVSNFESEASSHGLDVSYDSELSVDERDLEVCVSGSELGEYHGVLLLKEQQEGNSIVQMGVWMKVNVGESEALPSDASRLEPSASEGSGGSGSGSVTRDEEPVVEIEEVEAVEEEFEEETFEEVEMESLFTGEAIKDASERPGAFWFVGFMFIVGAGVLYWRKKK